MLVLAQQLSSQPTFVTLRDLAPMGPVLVLFAAVLVLIVIDVIIRTASRNRIGLSLAASAGIAIGAGVLAAIWAVFQWNSKGADGKFVAQQLFTAYGPSNPEASPQYGTQIKPFYWSGGALIADHFALLAAIAVGAVVVLVSLLLLAHLARTRTYRSEIFPLLLISATGMVLLGMSHDLLITFISIEILSLPLYVLCGLDQKRQTSQESALKYFLLGAFASGFLIYGVALVYGVIGNLNYSAITHYVLDAADFPALLAVGFALVGVGLAFKLALVPFHAWVPDVYQGAPTPITAFMAVGVKLAVFAAAARFMLECTHGVPDGYWRDGLALFAALSMIVGNLFALHQMSAKRLLAYSAIAHTGYLALALCTGDPLSAKSILVYLVGYGLASLGAFGLISYLAPAEQDDLYLDEMNELSRRAPVTSMALAILMLSMAGFPLTAGFVGKLLVFTDAWKAGLHGLVIFAVLNSVIGVYYYLRFVLAMYMQPKAPGAVEVHLRRMAGAYVIPALVTVFFTLLIGVLPQVLLDWTGYCTLGF
jgi:NADH-quinone oxidoreductase subunit N